MLVVAFFLQSPPVVYVSARVCRSLDDSFDPQLYEDTVMMRRKMEVEMADTFK